MVDSLQEEAPANAVGSESGGTINVDEVVPSNLSPLRNKDDEDVDEETRTNADSLKK